MARLEDGRIKDTYYRLIRPPRSRVYFTQIHGLTWAVLKNEPGFAELWQEMSSFMQGARWLIAHNAPFDRRVLQGCCAANGLTAPATPFACTLKGARRALPIPSRGLGAVCAHFGIDIQHHHAGSDAVAAAHIYVRLLALGIEPEVMRSGGQGAK